LITSVAKICKDAEDRTPFFRMPRGKIRMNRMRGLSSDVPRPVTEERQVIRR